MAKYKYILTVIITLCTIITYAQPAQYTPMTASGYQMKRLKVDSTLHLPSFCGVPTLRGSLVNDGALAIDTCGEYLYMWTRTGGWDTVNVSGGGAISNIPNLQQVTDSGNVTTKDIKANSYYFFDEDTDDYGRLKYYGYSWYFIDGDSVNRAVIGEGGIALKNKVSGYEFSIIGNNLTANKQFQMPNYPTGANQVLPISVNGNYADTAGNITINSGGDFWKTSGTTILTGPTFIGSNNQSLTFGAGDQEDMASITLQANDIAITPISGDLKFTSLETTTDTSTYKPLGISNAGVVAPLTSWVSGGTTIDTTNQFVKRLDRTPGKDSIIYFVGANRFAIKDSVGTNPAPVGYYGAFKDTTTQTAALINTAYPVNLKVTDLSNGVAVTNNSKIKIANAGIYNIQFSLQLEKSGGSGNMIADIWLRKNGVNIDGTTGKVVLTGSANASPIVAAWNYVVALSSNDSLELMWATTNDNVVIKAYPATSPHPSIPSAILTVTQQSGIMAGTGISPLDTANMLSNYARTNLVNTKLNISDTATMLSSYSTRINGKLNISDTTVLQRKSIPSYTFLANNTTSTANAQALPFKDTTGTYTNTITWGTSAPTGTTNHSYRWTRIGNMVTLNISLVYGTVSSGNTQVTIALPTGAPIPVQPAGTNSNSAFLYPATCVGGSTLTASTSVATNRGGLRNNSNNTGFEINMAWTTAATFIYFQTTVTYYTN